MPTATELNQKLPLTPETITNETPLIFDKDERHQNELYAGIKQSEPEATLPEPDMKAYRNYLENVMQSEHAYTEIGVPEQTEEEKAEEQSHKEPLLRMIGRGLVDFFPHLAQKTADIAGATVEDAKKTIERKRWYVTPSDKPLEFSKKRAVQLGQEPTGDKVAPPIVHPTPTPEPISTNAVQEAPSNVIQFPTQETAQPQPVTQKPEQIAA